MNRLKYLSAIAVLTAALTLSARGHFIQDNGDGVKMYNDFANKNISDFEGFVGANNSSVPHVDVHTTGNADTGSGYANIKPIKKGTLTQLIFTPENPNIFSGFSFRGQLDHDFARTVTLTVQDNQGNPFQTFVFSGLGNGDFARQGILSFDGETIQSVTLDGHFKEVKQIDWIFAPDPRSVPDGGMTLTLLGAALGSLGVARRFLKK